MGKKSKRTKTKKPDAAANSINRTPMDIVRADAKAIRAWMRKGRIDSTGFVKHAPKSAELLQEGKISCEKFLHYYFKGVTSDMINCSELGNFVDAIREVADGEDNIRNRCWECNIVCNGKKKCPGCTVALYCDRPCQVKAWKDGHCNSCSTLKSSYLTYKHDVKYIEAFHKARKDDSSLSSQNNNKALLNDDTEKDLLSQHMSHHNDFNEFQWDRAVDLYIACSNACMDSSTGAYISTYLSDFGLKGPSFEIFYANFRKVVNGDWWLYSHCNNNDDAFVEDLPCLFDQVALQGEYEDSHKYRDPFRIASFLLCYDHFSFFKDQGITDPSDITENSQFCTYVNHCKDCFHKAELANVEKGCFITSIDDISAKKYLKEYEKMEKYFKTGTSRSHKDNATYVFRKCLHKNANDIRTKLNL